MNDSIGNIGAFQALSVDECLDLLASHQIGRLGFVSGGEPVILPVNYLLHAGSVLFRTAEGSKLQSAVDQARVAFEVDQIDAERHAGWSILIKGRATEVWTAEELARVRDLPLQPWVPGSREHYVRILSSSITGRRLVQEPTLVAEMWWG